MPFFMPHCAVFNVNGTVLVAMYGMAVRPTGQYGTETRTERVNSYATECDAEKVSTERVLCLGGVSTARSTMLRGAVRHEVWCCDAQYGMEHGADRTGTVLSTIPESPHQF